MATVSFQLVPPAITSPGISRNEAAVLAGLAYSDLFDFPVTRREMARFAPFAPMTPAEVSAAVDSLIARGTVRAHGPYVFLAGRADTIIARRNREATSRAAWRQARRWAGVVWALPFVRMVAVTGSLAAGSMISGQDIDFLIVVNPGRLWTTRALCLLTWRMARIFGTRLCPNYLITPNALSIRQINLYTAREFVQMKPLHGRGTAERLSRANQWTVAFLPNARLDVDLASDDLSPVARLFKRAAETCLRGSLWDRLEAWERRRKIAQLTREVGASTECEFTADVCKHHSNAHGQRILGHYRERLLEVVP